MVTRDQIWNQLGKRPFQPFRVTLHDGKIIDIFRKNQAIVTPRQFIFADREGHMHWIQLERVQRMEVYELRQAAQ